jgi:hypothetical protein
MPGISDIVLRCFNSLSCCVSTSVTELEKVEAYLPTIVARLEALEAQLQSLQVPLHSTTTTTTHT